MSCALLKTDETKLRSQCKSRKWPDFIQTMVQHISFDGYTLSFNWDLENPMHSTPANSPLKPMAKNEVKEEEGNRVLNKSTGSAGHVKIGMKIPAPPIVAKLSNTYGEKETTGEVDETKE